MGRGGSGDQARACGTWTQRSARWRSPCGRQSMLVRAGPLSTVGPPVARGSGDQARACGTWTQRLARWRSPCGRQSTLRPRMGLAAPQESAKAKSRLGVGIQGHGQVALQPRQSHTVGSAPLRCPDALAVALKECTEARSSQGQARCGHMGACGLHVAFGQTASADVTCGPVRPRSARAHSAVRRAPQVRFGSGAPRARLGVGMGMWLSFRWNPVYIS